ncbi:PP2C family protein-serine/threonine phosphatase [Luteithermobacter gelatinilyticus]|uniref:PP2C family protein-serine/threonine phosphatase n=1 Tax=Luteithermobacter gelatinilyticus TaxID=2582913 RepID=UPI001105F1CF|nr:fused response regulator/phosphatase [Luteithermobacter gelatinilyticus]|tara:strand:- start:3385 stop:4569 length:1185 start_codon:yes stop_codon:yes gene_type:complete
MKKTSSIINREVLGGCILIVDDVELNRLLIHNYLTQAGFHNLHLAVDGQDALDKISQLNPDLVILDLIMPHTDGFEVCRKLRAHEMFSDLPILVQTAMSEPEERAQVFDAGATDLIAKPISPLEICARTRIHLENRFLLRDLRAYRKRLTRDLEIARDMQTALLPRQELLDEVEKEMRIQVAYRYESSDELGGDFWGLQRLGEQKLFFYMVDFAGHGVSAALNTFRLHSLISQVAAMESPAAYLEVLNRELCKLLPVEQFATMFCGLIDAAERTLTYASAACPVPLLGKRGTERVELLDPEGLPLGVEPMADYINRRLPLAAGDVLFIYSDVLAETPCHDGTRLEEAGVQEIFRSCLADGGDSRRVLEAFFEKFDKRSPRPLRDDLTAVFFTCQ